MTDVIVEMIAATCRAGVGRRRVDIRELNLADRKSESIANVVRYLRACLRTAAHYDADKANRKWFCRQPNRFIAARSAVQRTVWKKTPLIFPIGVQMHRIIAVPVLHSVLLGVWRTPMNPNVVYLSGRAQIDYHPLRMRIIGFACEVGIEIRIAFP